MSSTSTPKAIESRNALVARADEQLAQAHEEIARAGEELARLSEQLAKMERATTRPPETAPPPAAAPPPSAGLRQQSSPRRPAHRSLVGLSLAACIVVAALVLQSSYGGRAKLVVARWAPQFVPTRSLPPEKTPLPAQPSPSIVQQPAPSIVQLAAAAEPAPQQATPPQATPPAQTVSQDAAPTATAPPADQTQLLQTMARDLANLERSIEQLKANQQQIASDSSKAIEELKASQEEIKRVLAKVSEQNPPKTSPPPTQPTPTVHKPERTHQFPYARARPRIPRDWIYDDEW